MSKELLRAIDKKDVELVKKLIQQGADVNYRHGRVGPPLVRACSVGDIKIVKILIEAGADVNLSNWYGTPR
jgi:ankyrin repeat protein